MSAIARLSRSLMGSLRASPGAPCRALCSKAPTMDDVNALFAEARLSLQDATESKGTVYFEDDFSDAKDMTQQTLRAFDAVVAAANDTERESLLAANRPKMAQLRQEFDNLEHDLIHDDDH